MSRLAAGFDRSGEFPHLPPGHDPGAQSLRNRVRRTWLAPFVGFVGTAMFAAGIWVAAGGRGSGFDRQEELFGGLFFAAMGLVCLFGAFAIADRGRPKRHSSMRGTKLSLAPGEIRRGDEIAVTFSGRRRDGDRLEVGLACDERYDTEAHVYVKGALTVTRQTGEATVHEQWQPLPPGVAEHALVFVVPEDVPYSYEGDCLSYGWRVSVRDVRPLRTDARHDEPVWVEP